MQRSGKYRMEESVVDALLAAIRASDVAALMQTLAHCEPHCVTTTMFATERALPHSTMGSDFTVLYYALLLVKYQKHDAASLAVLEALLRWGVDASAPVSNARFGCGIYADAVYLLAFGMYPSYRSLALLYRHGAKLGAITDSRFSYEEKRHPNGSAHIIPYSWRAFCCE